MTYAVVPIGSRYSLLNFLCLAIFHFVHKNLGRLKAGDIVSGNYDGLILRNNAPHFLFSMLYNKTTKPSDVHIFSFGKGVFHNGKESFKRSRYIGFVNARLLRNFKYNFCFCHVYLIY